MLKAILCFVSVLIPLCGQIAVISHRGEHLRNPENTLAAFRAAVNAGADYFEVDVRTTVDGKFVLMHDQTVDRTTNGKGRVAGLTFAQVRALRVGTEPVPTLEEALAVARGRAHVYVDSKAISPAGLVAVLDRERMAQSVVVYGAVPFLKEVQKLRPAIRVMPESVSVEVIQQIIRELAPKVIAFSRRDWQDDIIRLAKQSGAGIFVDRLGPDDNPTAWQDAVDRGATGIQTDHPAELVTYLRSRHLHQ
ncbi:MAG: glycerophosphodiester phosphodiesterase family protein [Bryobacterales bacterium]|nr:glycerophosphodiester phosphodiesterase family protein [Bryobacterales bacterium]